MTFHIIDSEMFVVGYFTAPGRVGGGSALNADQEKLLEELKRWTTSKVVGTDTVYDALNQLVPMDRVQHSIYLPEDPNNLDALLLTQGQYLGTLESVGNNLWGNKAIVENLVKKATKAFTVRQNYPADVNLPLSEKEKYVCLAPDGGRIQANGIYVCYPETFHVDTIKVENGVQTGYNWFWFGNPQPPDGEEAFEFIVVNNSPASKSLRLSCSDPDMSRRPYFIRGEYKGTSYSMSLIPPKQAVRVMYIPASYRLFLRLGHPIACFIEMDVLPGTRELLLPIFQG